MVLRIIEFRIVYDFLEAPQRPMEPYSHRVMADLEVLRDLGILETGRITEGKNFLVSFAERAASVQEELDALLLEYPFFCGRHVCHEIMNPI
jgi:hypothetical protein